MSNRRTAANEFGTTDWEREFESNPQGPRHADRDYTRDQAHEELRRGIAAGELKPLNGRAPIEHDWMMDAPGWSEFNGPRPRGPSIAEQQQLYREHTEEMERLMSRPSAGMQDRNPDDQMPATAEALAEQLHREFTTAYKDLSGDSSAIERIARSEIETRGFSYADRHTLYERIANRLRAEGGRG